MEHSSLKITLWKVSPLSRTHCAYSNHLILLASRISWQYLVRCRVQPCCLRDLRTVDELTATPCFASFFLIWALVISSLFRICWSIKALASIDSFWGLPERGTFDTEPVMRSLLIMRVTLEKLTDKPSLFKDVNIPAGWRPCLWRSSIRVLV